MPSSSPAPARTDPSARFLGLAFAGADLVFEMVESGEITLAIGAVHGLTGRSDQSITGTRWTDLIAPADTVFLDTLVETLRPGERRGPFATALLGPPGAKPRPAMVSLFRLPENQGRISCAISLVCPPSLNPPREASGLVRKDAFDQVAADSLSQAERAGVDVRLELVEVPGLAAAVETMDDSVGQKTLSALAAMLRTQSYGGVGAAEVAADRFALVASEPLATDRISERISATSQTDLRVTAAGGALPPGDGAAQLKTLRYVLDRFIVSGAAAAARDFTTLVEGTARASAQFKVMVASGAFRLAYQPIVTLADGQLHHFEALARFDDQRGPAETLRMAEELGQILEFDMAVVKQVVRALANGAPDTKIAANISAASLGSPALLTAIEQLLAASRISPHRLLFEVTDTAHIADMEAARRFVAALRKHGHSVCLDDFDAASLSQVAVLEVDFVKLDGRYVRSLAADSRDAVLIKHTVSLCRELGVFTIAEKIETREAAEALQALGVNLGQGFVFGKPDAAPKWKPPATAGPSAARRKGAVESWS
jgi:EAL domain-containing protein (putative c-di-GMP-specific phosphodiesterase class I)